MIGPHKHKPETLVAPQNKSFHWQMECLPPWPSCKAEKGRTLGKSYRTKVWFYWEHIEEHIGNSMGTENPKNNPSARDPKEKKLGPCQSMLSLLLGCIKFLFLKLFVTIFDLSYWKAWGVPCMGGYISWLCPCCQFKVQTSNTYPRGEGSLV